MKKERKKINLKKGYKNEILKLLHILGVIPYRSLRVLSRQPRLYQRVIQDMQEYGIVVVDSKGGEKNIRLRDRRESKRNFAECIPPEYIEYYDSVSVMNARRLTEKSNSPDRIFRHTGTQMMMYAAGVDISPNKRDLSETMLKDEDIVYYDSVELKKIEKYHDEVAYEKNGSESISKKLQNSRINGVLISPGGAFAVYNIGKSLIEWKRFGEIKMAMYIATLIRHKSESEISMNAPKEAIVIAQRPSMYIRICNEEGREKKKLVLMNIDYAYDRMYAVPEDLDGVMMLKMMSVNGWRKKIYDSILTPEEREASKYVSIQCDGYDKEKDIYKQVFCVPDLTSLKQFVTRGKLEQDKKRFIIYCYKCQQPYVSIIAGIENFTILSIDIQYFYSNYFTKKEEK